MVRQIFPFFWLVQLLTWRYIVVRWEPAAQAVWFFPASEQSAWHWAWSVRRKIFCHTRCCALCACWKKNPPVLKHNGTRRYSSPLNLPFSLLVKSGQKWSWGTRPHLVAKILIVNITKYHFSSVWWIVQFSSTTCKTWLRPLKSYLSQTVAVIHSA